MTGSPAAVLIIGVAVPGVPWLLSAGRAEKRAIARLEAAEAWTHRLSDIVAGIGLQQAKGVTAATAPRRIETDSSERYQRQMRMSVDPGRSVVPPARVANSLRDGASTAIGGSVSTDIYGAIEVYRLEPYDDPADIGPWMRALDLYPLYRGNDYFALGCLFGVRNWAGWEPIAAGRGLPGDVSEAVRAEFETDARIDSAVGGQTWVSWAELNSLDMTVTPQCRGVLEAWTGPECRYQRVDDEWPAFVVAEYGAPPLGRTPAEAPYGTWQVGDVRLKYHAPTRLDALGPNTGWEHVFAVMEALAGRFGDDGVRIVAWFD